MKRERHALFEGPEAIADDGERDAALTPIYDRLLPLLEEVCSYRAETLPGHLARATVYQLWVSGELGWLARNEGSIEDRLLAALVYDLVGEPR